MRLLVIAVILSVAFAGESDWSCESLGRLDASSHGGTTDPHQTWNTECSANHIMTAMYSPNSHYNDIDYVKCCKNNAITINYGDCEKNVMNGDTHGGSYAADATWKVQCSDNYVAVGFWDDDDSYSDIDYVKCCRLGGSATVANTDTGCTVYMPLDSSNDGGSNNADIFWNTQCPWDKVMVGLWDDNDYFGDIDGMKCCPINTNGGGSVGGDPHFTGFSGEAFDFHGFANGVFNLISSPETQVNTHFSGMLNTLDSTSLTLMDIIAVRTPAHEIVISANGTMIVDGTPVHAGRKVEDEGFSASWSEGAVSSTNLLSKDLQTRWYGGVPHISSHQAQLSLGNLNMDVFVVSSKRLPGLSFLDVQVSLTSGTNAEQMHGILGQTARGTAEGRGLVHSVEGDDMDYLVRDGLFGTDFTFNLY